MREFEICEKCTRALQEKKTSRPCPDSRFQPATMVFEDLAKMLNRQDVTVERWGDFGVHFGIILGSLFGVHFGIILGSLFGLHFGIIFGSRVGAHFVFFWG